MANEPSQTGVSAPDTGGTQVSGASSPQNTVTGELKSLFGNSIFTPAYSNGGGFFETINFKGHLGFISYEDKKFVLRYNLKIGDVTVETFGEPNVPYQDYKFDALPVDVPTTSELLKAVHEVFKKFIDIEDSYRHLFASICLLSYRQDLFQTVPYLDIVGDTGTGKTTIEQILTYLTYRPLYGTSLPPADVFTYLGIFKKGGAPGTIIEDEAQGIEKDGEKLKIFKAGYKKGAVVPRIERDRNDRRQITYFPCFCIKVLGGEDEVNDKGLKRRCINVRMFEGDPEENLDNALELDPASFDGLRNKLLCWRVAGVLGRSVHEKVKLQAAFGDLRELWGPLLKVAYDTESFPILSNLFVKGFGEKHESFRYSLDGYLAKILQEECMLKNQYDLIPFEFFWVKLKEVGFSDVVYRPDTLSSPDGNYISKADVAKKLKIDFGGKKDVFDNKRIYSFEQKRVEKAVERYLMWETLKPYFQKQGPNL